MFVKEYNQNFFANLIVFHENKARPNSAKINLIIIVIEIYTFCLQFKAVYWDWAD